MEVATFPVHRLDPASWKQDRARANPKWQPSEALLQRLGLFGTVRDEFLRRFWLAEAIKTDLREAWARHNRKLLAPAFDDGQWRERWVADSLAFWQSYEEVNRRLLPEDPVYSITQGGLTLSTSAVQQSYSAASAGQARILESYIGGEATTSTPTRVGVFRATSAGSTPTAYTLNKLNSRSASAGGTAATAWGTQPTDPSTPLFYHAFNTFGGTDRWVPQPGEEAYFVNSEEADWAAKLGTPTVSMHGMIEEL